MKKSYLKRSFILLMCCMMVFSLVACSSGTSKTSVDNNPGNSASDNPDKDTSTKTPDSDSNTAEKVVVNISNNQPLTTLDRFNQMGSENYILGMLWGDMLVSTDHNGTYEPWVAEEVSTSEDALSATITIKKGINFHNGQELTSKDVKRTFDRILEDTSLVNYAKWGKYLGTVDAPDDHTVILHFTQPMPAFYSELSLLPLINADAYDQDPKNFFSAPVGTGPYKVASFDPISNEVTLERNDDWWAWTEENKSNVDQIHYRYVAEDTTRVSSLRAGELDICESVPSDNIDLLRGEGFNVNNFDSFTFIFLGLGSSEGKVFNDINLRQALSLSIDRQLIVDSILGGGKVASWPSPEGHVTFENQGYEYDVDRAKELLASSSYKGEELKMIVNIAETLRGAEVAQAIQSMASEAGFNITIETMEAATYNERRAAGNYDISLCVNAMTNGEFYISSIEVNGIDRFATGYDNPQMKALAEKGMTLVDMQERVENAKAIYQIVMDNFAPNIYLYRIPGCIVTSSSLENVTVYGDNLLDLRYMKKN